MKTLSERLRAALAGPPAKTQAALARACGIRPPSVNDWLSGKTKKIEGENLLRASAFLEVSPIWLATGRGPMKTPGQKREEANFEGGPVIKGRIPIISWVQAGDWCEAIDNFAPGDAEDWAPFAGNHSDGSFALRVRGPSMEPRFFDGEIIVVDPLVSADNGRFVIAKKTSSQEATFKQLVCEGGEAYLRALNESWPEPIIRVDEEWHICGVVIAKMVLF